MQYKNIYFKKIIIKVFMLFILLISFGILVFFVKKNNSFKTISHIAINFPQGYNDHGFNQNIIEGVCLGEGLTKKECNREKKEFYEKITYAFPGTSSDPEKFFEHVAYYIKIYGTKKFIIPGFTATDFFLKYLEYFKLNNPNVKFFGIDSYYNNKIWSSNFWQVNFLHWYSGYHAGIYAAAWAAENHERLKDADTVTPGKQIYFSSIGGMSIPAILKYAFGFKLGINIFNKIYQKEHSEEGEKIEFIHSYYDSIGSFDSSNLSVKKKAKAITEKHFSRGSSIVFMIATSLVFNAIEAAIEQDQKIDKEHFVIGVDVDVNKQISDVMKKKVITSAIINFSKIIKEVYDSEFSGSNPIGKDLIFGGHSTGTIVERDKETLIWNKYFVNPNSKFNSILKLNSLSEFILGKDNKQIALITSKKDKSNLEPSDKGIIYRYFEYLANENKITRIEEFQKILKKSNDKPLEKMREIISEYQKQLKNV